MEGMMNDDASATAPGSYWAVAGIGMLWNAFGAYLYMMARIDPQAVMAGAPPEMQAYVANMPLWANIGYGLGIWGSFAGSALMLIRSRHAVTAFLVSLIGAVVSFAGQAMAGVLQPAEPAVILAVIVFLWWFARRSEAQGLLR
jgi:hypothetical protein